MTPEDLAARHPRLFHLTDPEGVPSILRHGLLPTRDLLTLFDVPAADRFAIEGRCRPSRVRLAHPRHGRATVSDNSPLSEAALERCLDDGLAPADWLAMLNARVFFWAEERAVDALLHARRNRGEAKALLVFDTLGLVRAHRERTELSAINSGATMRRPARRGAATFTPLGLLSYDAWRRRRGRLDRVREVTVAGPVPDAGRHLLETRLATGGVGLRAAAA